MKILIEVLDSKFVPALLGFASALILFFLNEWKKRQNERRQENKKYLVCLKSTFNELEFYKGKLKYVSEQLGKVLDCLENNSYDFVIPSYSLYPAFLEKAKMDLSGFFQNSDLVKIVGHCHFELCHISERLTRFKSLPPASIQSNRLNITGMKGLVDANIITFSDAVQTLKLEIEKTGLTKP